MSIPASKIVEVTPGVLGAGGSAFDTIGLILTSSTRVPIGAVQAFGNALDVSTYFGPGSTEYEAASIYFNGFFNSAKKPGSVLFAQFNPSAVSGYLRGGDVSDLALSALQALTGTLTITTAGTPLTSGSIDLSGATSFSNAATLIQAAFTTPPFAVSYDSQSGGFVFTTTGTGGSATMGFATGTGTILDGLKLTAALGAVTSQGAAAATPSAFMTALINVNRSWATFSTLFNPDSSGNANKLAFATWCGQQNDKFAYCCWDTDAAPTTTVPATSSLGYLLDQSDISGTILVYAPDYKLAVFAQAWAASLDFDQQQGRATLKFKGQSGLTPSVTTASIGDNLIANGYNFYGDYATSNQDYVFFSPGSISGPFLWADSYINQIALNADLQTAGMELFVNTKSIPYNNKGYGLVQAALRDPILRALNFGSIQPGVALSESQKAEVNNAAGVKIDDVLSTAGWYLQVSPAAPSTRVARESPPINLWYCDGQSIQRLEIASINVQ